MALLVEERPIASVHTDAARTACAALVVLIAAIVLIGAGGLAGCGGSRGATSATDATRERDPRPPPATRPRRVAPVRSPEARAARSLRPCDRNIGVRAATTSCPFAQNVFYSYWLNEREPGVFADSPGLPAYSPAAGRTFYVDCIGASRVTCRGGSGAYVTFPGSAVAAYTLAAAERYAAVAELGGVPAPSEVAPAEDPSPSSDSEGCDPSYAGACLDATSSDYDCAGGRGNGPDYTGRVSVVGDDHFGLDRDGDGIGCE